IRETRFSGSGSATRANRRADGDRSFLRFSGKARREDPGRIEKPRRHAAERAQRTGPKRNSPALQQFTGTLDPFRIDDRFRRRITGVALPPHQTGRAHDRSQKRHRWIARRTVPQRIIVQTNLSRSVDDKTSDVSGAANVQRPMSKSELNLEA